MAKEQSSRVEVDIVAGLAVFFSMSYAAFANPIILQQAHIPAAPVFYATCLMGAAASFASGFYAKSAAALAPGLALSGALVQFLNFSETTIRWESAFIVCAGSGVFLFWASVGGFRRRLVNAIPISIKLAVTGGVGAVLADNAIKLMREQSGIPDQKMLIFMIGLLIILSGYFVARGIAMKMASPFYANMLDLVGRSSFFLSVLCVAVLFHKLQSEPITQVVENVGGVWLWSSATLTFSQALQGAIKWESLSLFLFIMYILFADIVGSPYHLVLDDHHYRYTDPFDAREEKQVKRSFVVDSIANLLAPILGASPVVYYAENFAGKVLGGREPLVAYVSSVGFLVLLVVGYVLASHGNRIDLLIPGIAVAPALLVVGILIIGKSLGSAASIEHQESAPRQQKLNTDERIAEFAELAQKLPAAIAIVGTPLVGFEIGTATGILSYFFFSRLLLPAEEAENKPEDGAFSLLAFLAVLSVLIKLKLSF